MLKNEEKFNDKPRFINKVSPKKNFNENFLEEEK